MKLDKLAKQIRRDLMANPKKAGALGLMLLVAAYFWAPLAWRWLMPKDKKTAKAAVSKLILTDDPAEPTAKGKPGALPPFRWEKVRQLMNADPRMVTALLDAAWRDPFKAPPAPPESESPEQGKTEEETQRETTAQAIEVGPEQAGLKLVSIAIGPRGRSAIINGETYRVGQVIVGDVKDPAKTKATIDFVIVRIERTRVELERNGKAWQLQLDQPKLARGDEIERAQPNKQD